MVLASIKQQTKTLLKRATAPVEGAAIGGVATQPLRTYQAVVAGEGAVTATIDIHVSIDGENWLVMGRITLSGTDYDMDGFVADAPWPYSRAVLTAISGTHAAVDVLLGD